MRVKDANLGALLESRASHNFVNQNTAERNGWELHHFAPLQVRLADKT